MYLQDLGKNRWIFFIYKCFYECLNVIIPYAYSKYCKKTLFLLLQTPGWGKEGDNNFHDQELQMKKFQEPKFQIPKKEVKSIKVPSLILFLLFFLIIFFLPDCVTQQGHVTCSGSSLRFVIHVTLTLFTPGIGLITFSYFV
jgi:hypothetical protein